MKNINITVAQLTPKLGDKQYNYERIAETIIKAKENDAQLVVFPEMFLSGYSVGENITDMAETTDGTYMTKIRYLCKQHNIYSIVSFPEHGDNGKYYISSSLIDDQGAILGTYRKIHLFDTEKISFEPGSSFEVIDTPLGKIGMMICFDVEFPEISRALKLMGADFIVIVNANMHPYEMQHHIYSRSRAMENEIPVIICNRLGKEGELDFCGDSMIIDATGEIILSLKDREVAKTGTISLNQKLDPKMNYVLNRREELYDILIKK